MGIVISIGKYGGFYIVTKSSFRICLGWIAITFFAFDGDYLLQLAAERADQLKESTNVHVSGN